MIKKMIFFLLAVSLLTGISVMCVFSNQASAQSPTPVEEKVGVLITAWGLSEGNSFDFYWTLAHEAIGYRTEYEDQPCRAEFSVGPFPYQSSMNIVPFHVLFPVEGREYAWDSSGLYRYDLATNTFYSIKEDHPSVHASTIPGSVPIVPLKDVLDNNGNLNYPLDPNTGEDHLAGWYKIGDYLDPTHYFSNGLHDFQEAHPARGIQNFGITGGPTDPVEANSLPPEIVETETMTQDLLEADFGDRIDVRHGYYGWMSGVTKYMADVAEEFGQEGFTKLLLSRETTDNNHFANVFSTGNFCRQRLCEIGVLDDMFIHQTRQVGRTPEFNAMNVINLRPFIEAYPAGSTLGILYVTRGLPWANENTNDTVAFYGRYHPWSKEVYHDNAYLNYLSFKKALIKAFGDDYNLVFNKGDTDSDIREDNFYSYSMDWNEPFNSTREAIQMAKAEGLDKLIVIPAHWNYDNLDSYLHTRLRNGLPVNPRSDLQADIFHLTYCEDAADNETACESPDAVAEILLAPAYSSLPEEFGIAYYVRLLGGLEQFGLYPGDVQFGDNATAAITKLAGGIVEVTDTASNVAGAKIVIPPDPYPNWPESFTPSTAIPIDDPADTNDCMWEDMDILVAERVNPPDMVNATPSGPAVQFGPYRALFNRDVTITIPYDTNGAQGSEVKPYIYNHLTKTWDELQAESYGSGLLIFKTKVLGLFQVGMTDCDDKDADSDGIGNACDNDTIYGTISGAIQEGVNVKVYVVTCGAGQPYASLTTDAQGYFALGDIANGRYLVVPEDADYSFSAIRRWVNIPQTEIQPYNFIATEKIAVLITGWGTPEGFSDSYWRNMAKRSRFGDRAEYEDQPCTEHHYGTYPYRSQIGLIPYGLVYPVEGNAIAAMMYDRYGLYRLGTDDETYEAVFDNSVTITKTQVNSQGLTVELIKDTGLGADTRSTTEVDPRDNQDLLFDIFHINAANGINDHQEIGYVGGIRNVRFMTDNWDSPAYMNPSTVRVESVTKDLLNGLFGDTVDVRSGYYCKVEGLSDYEEDVAIDFADEGYKRLLIARETTDNNNYANKIMSRETIEAGLCKAGKGDAFKDIKQVRQVGRTPEYNWAVMQMVAPHFDEYKTDGVTDVVVIYSTYGLSWPFGNPENGIFSVVHPFTKEVYHENAFMNYLSFKRYLMAEYDQSNGGDYNLILNHGGGNDSDLRADSYYAYTMRPQATTAVGDDFGFFDDELKFLTVREQIEKAKEEGQKEVLIVWSHWYYNNVDTILSGRIINDLPFNSREEAADGTFTIEWCEDYTGNNTYTQKTKLKGTLNPDGSCENPNDTHIRLTEAFDPVMDEFAIGYAARLRGGIERFDTKPDLGISVSATEDITYEDGGTVEVTSGLLKGAKLEVAADMYLNEPESYEFTDLYQPESAGKYANTDSNAFRAFNDPEDPLTSAWFDFTAYIGTQLKALTWNQDIDKTSKIILPDLNGRVSPRALFGPYRTLFNRPATVTLPYNESLVGNNTEAIKAYIYNEVTLGWDPIYPVPGGEMIEIDTINHTASFQVQVLGIFALGIVE